MAKFTAFLQALAPVLSAVSWPAVLIVFAVSQRKRLQALADLLLKRLKSDQKVEFGSLKLEAAVDQKLKEAQNAATGTTGDKELPPEQIALSRGVVDAVDKASDNSSSYSFIKSRVEDLAWEYEDLRRRRSRGSERTDRMNQDTCVGRQRLAAGIARL